MNSNSYKVLIKLKSDITSYFSSDYGTKLIKLYSKRFSIPSEVISQYFKLRISLNYAIKNSKFDNNLLKSSIFLSIIKYIGYLFTVLIFSKVNNNKHHYLLLIDDMQHFGEIDRWLDLEKLFTIEKTVFIAKSSTVKPLNGNNILYRPHLKGYDRNLLIKKFPKMLFNDLFFLIFWSLKLNINLVHLHLNFINDYLYYHSLFKICKARYMIQDRHLGRTNALKNYLFKLNGGVASSCLQKNILQHNGPALFYDTDIFFTFGDKTADDLLTLGARIDNIIPVGSQSMHNALSNINVTQEKRKNKFDVLFIGINTKSTKTEWRFNYESIEWLVRLTLEKPNLKIAIKHHPSWLGDKKEYEITKDSSIEYIDYSMNSYEAGFQSNLVLTYGSSMGYEFVTHGVNVAFLDPGNENPFINNFIYSDNIVINKYDELKYLIQNDNNIIQKLSVKNKNDYCHPEYSVPNKIHKYLTSYASIEINKE